MRCSVAFEFGDRSTTRHGNNEIFEQPPGVVYAAAGKLDVVCGGAFVVCYWGVLRIHKFIFISFPKECGIFDYSFCVASCDYGAAEDVF